MALGIQTESGAGGNFTPTVKINSKQGRVWRVDRSQGADGWQTDEVDITNSFQFVPDLDNIEVGWMLFKAASAPDLKMVRLGEDMPSRPSGDHKQGARLIVKLGKESGGDVREISATAKSVLGPIDKLHDEWTAAKADNPGKAPLVRMTGMKKVDTKTQHGTNTNFEPVFEIVRWIDKPSFAVAAPAEAPEEKAPPKQEAKKEMAEAGEEF